MDQNDYEQVIGELQHILGRLDQSQRKRKSPYSIYETETKVIAAIKLPGFQKENIELFLTDETIEIKTKQLIGNKVNIRKTSENLPVRIHPNSAKAEFTNSILRIEMNKFRSQKKKINIGGNDE